MNDARKHWRSGTLDETQFRVELWTGEDGSTMVKSVQIGEGPPALYSDGELHAASADEAFALAEQSVKQRLEQAQSAEEQADEESQESGSADPS